VVWQSQHTTESVYHVIAARCWHVLWFVSVPEILQRCSYFKRQEQVVKLEQGLQDSAIIICHNEKWVCSSLLTKWKGGWLHNEWVNCIVLAFISCKDCLWIICSYVHCQTTQGTRRGCCQSRRFFLRTSVQAEVRTARKCWELTFAWATGICQFSFYYWLWIFSCVETHVLKECMVQVKELNLRTNKSATESWRKQLLLRKKNFLF